MTHALTRFAITAALAMASLVAITGTAHAQSATPTAMSNTTRAHSQQPPSAASCKA